MRLRCNRTLSVVLLACSVSLMPLQQVLAANPFAGGEKAKGSAATGAVVGDIELAPGGVLKGQVVDVRGTPRVDAPVRLIKSGAAAEAALACQTNAEGRFQVAGLSGGVYRIETPAGATMFRVWPEKMAPPSAIPEALFVEGGEAVRGNLSNVTPLGWALIGVGIAAAIAIPLALDDDDAS